MDLVALAVNKILNIRLWKEIIEEEIVIK